MTDSSGSQALSSDQPGTDPRLDRFGFAPFARHLARTLTAMASAEHRKWRAPTGPAAQSWPS